MSIQPTVGWIIRRTAMVISFWIFAVVVLLYMAGVRVNLQAGILQPTASIYLELWGRQRQPVEYVLNGQSSTDTAPITIGKLTPGPYSLTVRQPGKVEWHRSFRLSAGEAINFRDILLVPDVLTPREPSESELVLSAEPVTPASDGLRLNVNELYRENSGGQESLLLRLSEPISQATWLPRETHVLLLVGRSVMLVEKAGTNMTTLLSVDSEQPVRLYATRSGAIIVVEGEKVQSYDLVEPRSSFWGGLSGWLKLSPQSAEVL